MQQIGFGTQFTKRFEKYVRKNPGKIELKALQEIEELKNDGKDNLTLDLYASPAPFLPTISYDSYSYLSLTDSNFPKVCNKININGSLDDDDRLRFINQLSASNVYEKAEEIKQNTSNYIKQRVATRKEVPQKTALIEKLFGNK